MPGGSGKGREIKFGFVGREHDGAVWVTDRDWLESGMPVDDGGVDGAEVCRAASVGDGVGWLGSAEWCVGGRTYRGMKASH